MSDRVAVIGSNMIDLITYVDRMPERGETIDAPAFSMGFGGKGANQAIAAARLGASVMMVTCVGDDMFGPRVKANLVKNGVDVSYVRTVDGKASGVAPIFVEPDGENAILIVKGANENLEPADIDRAAEELIRYDILLLQLEVPLEVVYRAISFGKKHGITTILNPAPARTELNVSQLDGLQWFCPNESELALLTGMPTRSENDVVAAARALIEIGIRNVVVTLGGRGARLVTVDEVTEIAPVPVDPVDTTGAGDAFIGCFARFLSGGSTPVEALRRASQYAALSIMSRGTQSSYASSEAFESFCVSRS